jgi:translocation and assembly module TamA
VEKAVNWLRRGFFFAVFATCCLFTSALGGEAKKEVTYEVQGVSGKIVDNILAHLKNNAKQEIHGKALAQSSMKKAVYDALLPYGYFLPTVTFIKESYNQHDQIKVQVISGYRCGISKLEVLIQGDQSVKPMIVTLLKQHGLERHKVFVPVNYQKVKQLVKDQLKHLGFAKATLVKSKVTVDLAEQQSQVYFKVHTGKRYRFSKTVFFNTSIRKSLLHRFLSYKPNQYFQQTRLAALQKKLYDSGYFRQITIEPRFHVGSDKVPVRVQLYERKRLRYYGGFGFYLAADVSNKFKKIKTQEFGYRAFVGAKFRRLNERGHKASFRYLFTEKLNQYDFNYMIPGKKPQVDRYRLGFVRKGEDSVTIGDSDEKVDIDTAHLSLGHQSKLAGWTRVFSFHWVQEQSTHIAQPTLTHKVVYPRVAVSRVWKNNTKAIAYADLSANLLVSRTGWGSTIGLTRGVVDSSAKYRINSNNSIFVHGALGFLDTRKMAQVPSDLLLLTGGEASVRGYNFNEIGPGKYLKVIDVEAQKKLYGALSVLAFYDRGIVADHFNAVMKASYGFGVMYRTPVGKIAFSLAQPQGTNLWRIQLMVRP